MAGLEREYQYAPLTKGAIRLLRIDPASQSSQELVGELSEADISVISQFLFDKPIVRYEALSWTWEASAWNQLIRIRTATGHYFLRAPLNLVAAIKELRGASTGRTLWIDAICINQQDTEEKNRQVSIMSEIYSAATRVCVWLGPGDEDSKLAIDFMRTDLLSLQDFDQLYAEPKARPKWEALLSLMKRPWFTRRWVVQEIVMAKDASIYCGVHSIKWNKFAETVQLFLQIESGANRFTEAIQKENETNDRNRMSERFHREYISDLGASILVDATTGTFFQTSKHGIRQPLLSLEYLVSSLAGFQVSEPRDCIYSLLAMAKNTQRVDARENGLDPLAGWSSYQSHQAPIGKKPYQVDYNLPFVDICKEFMMFSIQNSDPTRALDILCRPWASMPAIDSSSDESTITAGPILPTWIATVRKSPFVLYQPRQHGTRLGRKNADPLVGLPYPGQPFYNAANGTEFDKSSLRFKKGATYESIFVSGFIFDKVAAVCPAPPSGQIPEAWLTFGGWTQTDYALPPEDLWRTLVGDRHSSGKNTPTYFRRALYESAQESHGNTIATTRLINRRVSSAMSEFLRRVQAVTWSRTLVRTQAAALGIAPRAAEVGDLVCILYGCSVPVILRRKLKQNLKEEEVVSPTEDAQNATISMQNGERMSQIKREPSTSSTDTVKEEPDMDGVTYSGRESCKKYATKLNDHVDTEHVAADESEDYYYEFIGESYIHGMMDGDAIKLQQEQGIRSETFELR